ncbi:MAG: GNAT family N-acetyltransferase [Erysipelotrichaceae bacterium]
MVYLKAINLIDVDKEYEAIIEIPENENGFVNNFSHVTKEEFINSVIPSLIEESKGINLKEGYVPSTYYFLWDDDNIVGLFKIRHYLTNSLENGAGHIGYGILKKYRQKGYATKGLKLCMDICLDLIKEDEIYLSCNKCNVPSLKVQMKCGAYIVGENDNHYLTRIKIRG